MPVTWLKEEGILTWFSGGDRKQASQPLIRPTIAFDKSTQVTCGHPLISGRRVIS